MEPLRSEVFFDLANITVGANKMDQPLCIRNSAGNRNDNVFERWENLDKGKIEIRAHVEYEQSAHQFIRPSFLRVRHVKITGTQRGGTAAIGYAGKVEM